MLRVAPEQVHSSLKGARRRYAEARISSMPGYSGPLWNPVVDLSGGRADRHAQPSTSGVSSGGAGRAGRARSSRPSDSGRRHGMMPNRRGFGPSRHVSRMNERGMLPVTPGLVNAVRVPAPASIAPSAGVSVNPLTLLRAVHLRREYRKLHFYIKQARCTQAMPLELYRNIRDLNLIDFITELSVIIDNMNDPLLQGMMNHATVESRLDYFEEIRRNATRGHDMELIETLSLVDRPANYRPTSMEYAVPQ